MALGTIEALSVLLTILFAYQLWSTETLGGRGCKTFLQTAYQNGGNILGWGSKIEAIFRLANFMRSFKY